MSAPVLSQITSVNAIKKGQPWFYQPAVKSGGPATGWTAEGLPPGISINGTTGRVSGVPTSGGVAVISIKAHDSGGLNSLPLLVPLGIEDLPFQTDGAIRLNVKLQTGEVYLPDTGGLPLFAKAGDTKLVAIGFEDDGILQEVPLLTLLNVSLKVWDDDPKPIPLSDGTFIKTGDYNTTRYLVVLDFDTDQRIREAFDEFEDPHGTGFAGLAEIERIWYTWVPGYDTPRPCRDTSRNFKLSTWRDLDPTRRVTEMPE